MNVFLIGATGYTGSAVYNGLKNINNINLKILVRNPKKLEPIPSNVEVVKGSITDNDILINAMNGSDIVINCIGINGKGNGRDTTFISDSTASIISAMKKSGTDKIIALSNTGIGESFKYQPWIFRKIVLPYFLKWLIPIMKDKEIMEKYIVDSGLDYQILRCPNINDRYRSRSPKVSANGSGIGMSISRKTLSEYIEKLIFDFGSSSILSLSEG